MESVFPDFIDRVRGLGHPGLLRDAMARSVGDLGFEKFMFLFSDTATGETLAISNYPEGWLQRYAERNYVEIDPVVEQATQSTTSFHWGGDRYLKRLPESRRHFFHEAGEFGIRQGFCCVWSNRGGRMSGLSLVSDRSEAEFERLTQRHRADLELMALYFCGHVERNLIDRMAHRREDPLTPREKDCLTWTLAGRAPGEIADIVRSTDDMVRHCLDSATRKLGAPDAVHAAARAIELGLICP